jgi:hypothetical protein
LRWRAKRSSWRAGRGKEGCRWQSFGERRKETEQEGKASRVIIPSMLVAQDRASACLSYPGISIISSYSNETRRPSTLRAVLSPRSFPPFDSNVQLLSSSPRSLLERCTACSRQRMLSKSRCMRWERTTSSRQPGRKSYVSSRTIHPSYRSRQHLASYPSGPG